MTIEQTASYRHDTDNNVVDPELEERFAEMLSAIASEFDLNCLPDTSTVLVTKIPFGGLGEESLNVAHTVSAGVDYGSVGVTSPTDPDATFLAFKSRNNRTWASKTGNMSDNVLIATLQNHWPLMDSRQPLDELSKRSTQNDYGYSDDETSGKLLDLLEQYALTQSPDTAEYVTTWDGSLSSMFSDKSSELSVIKKADGETIKGSLNIPYEVDGYPVNLECLITIAPDNQVDVRASYVNHTTGESVQVPIADMESIFKVTSIMFTQFLLIEMGAAGDSHEL